MAPHFPGMRPEWTAGAPLPGGDTGGGPAVIAKTLLQRYPALPLSLLETLASRHGTLATAVLGNARSVSDLGVHFGESLYAREVDYLIANEWAESADDILWRRTKAGLALDDNSQQALARYIATRGHTQAPSVRVP